MQSDLPVCNDHSDLPVCNYHCGLHKCPSSMWVDPDVGGRRVNWPAFLEAYDPAAVSVEFVEMHSDHFTAEFSDAATGDTLLRICVLSAQKAQIEAWMQPTSTTIH